MERLNGIVTSISRDHHPYGLGSDHLYATAGLDPKLINQAYMGDIGGVGILKKGHQESKIIQSHWTGLLREHLAGCATRAVSSQSTGPGVVVVAIGAGRTETLLECIRLGLINHLVIDNELSQQLKNALPRASGADTKARTKRGTTHA